MTTTIVSENGTETQEIPLEVLKINAAFPDAIKLIDTFRGDLRLTIFKEYLRDICKLLKEDPELQYNFFGECLGVDYLDKFPDFRFQVVYNLYSVIYEKSGIQYGTNRRLFLKVCVEADKPEVDSITSVYPGALFPEREVYDMFGIKFLDHPDLRRILMSDDWVGHPQRKDYPLGGERVQFPNGKFGPAVSEVPVQHPGESYRARTGDVQGEKQYGTQTAPPVPPTLPTLDKSR